MMRAFIYIMTIQMFYLKCLCNVYPFITTLTLFYQSLSSRVKILSEFSAGISLRTIICMHACDFMNFLLFGFTCPRVYNIFFFPSISLDLKKCLFENNYFYEKIASLKINFIFFLTFFQSVLNWKREVSHTLNHLFFTKFCFHL